MFYPNDVNCRVKFGEHFKIRLRNYVLKGALLKESSEKKIKTALMAMQID